jgi:hypothetical protein
VDAEILIILCAKSDCKNICWAIKIVSKENDHSIKTIKEVIYTKEYY